MYDALVIGVGGMGSAVLYHLARRGQRVLGLEQFDIPHEMGSSHGVNRIIRLAYAEDPRYVPLLRRAYSLWSELEREIGRQLLVITGGLDAGPIDSAIVTGSIESCRRHDISYEELDPREVRRRYPGYKLASDMVAVYQANAGFVLAEDSILAHVGLARDAGAEIHEREPVVDWDAEADLVSVRTRHSRYQARKMIVTAGAWASKLVPELAPLAIPERQVLMWAEPTKAEHFQVGALPIVNMDSPEGRFYGFPIYKIPGFKIGKYHHRRENVDPDSMNRECSREDEHVLREAIKRYFPGANGRTLLLKACIFTNTPDEHFLLDTHPEASNVYIAAGFSGHGYKFCSVIGEILADLVVSGQTDLDIALFRFARFSGKH